MFVCYMGFCANDDCLVRFHQCWQFIATLYYVSIKNCLKNHVMNTRMYFFLNGEYSNNCKIK